MPDATVEEEADAIRAFLAQDVEPRTERTVPGPGPSPSPGPSEPSPTDPTDPEGAESSPTDREGSAPST